MEALPIIAGILVLGIGAQYLAWRLRVPSILLLLLTGFLAGPVTGFIQPDKLLGDFLLPIVGVSVAILLFEGGMALSVKDIRGHGKVVTSLVTVGVAVTFVLGSLAARFLLQLSMSTSLLVGAVVVVSGPTVVMPLLRHVRPKASVDGILRWEGILIDPIGALLALLVFEAVSHGFGLAALEVVLPALGLTLLIGTLVGLLAAMVVVMLEKRYWLPDYLSSPVVLALVVLAYASSEMMQHESGLLATTVMGIALANQRKVDVHHIIDFKENLSLILIGSLFILLAARMDIDSLLGLLRNPGLYGFLAVLIFVARPLGVKLASWKTDLTWQEQAFVAWMAPRGIVAAAVSAFFALQLDSEDGDQLVPIVFLVIVATVLLYGLTSRPLAKWLGIAGDPPQGVLIVGANQVGRAIAGALQEAKLKVLLVDNDVQALTSANVEGLTAKHGHVHDTRFAESLPLDGIGRMFAMTSREETNTLASVHMGEEFGRAMVYQIDTADKQPSHLRGRQLFGDVSYAQLRDRLQTKEWSIRATPITPQFSATDYRQQYPDAIRLFTVQDGKLRVFTGDYQPAVEAGITVVSLVRKSKLAKRAPLEEE